MSTISGSGQLSVLGLPASVTALRGDPARDRLTIEGAAGDDDIDGGGAANAFALVQDGGAGDDELSGSSGDDVQIGGDGADFVTGRRGHDRALLTGTAAGERVAVFGDGGRARVARDGATALDTAGLEALTVHVFGGADRVTVADLSGTDLAGVGVSLADLGGGGAQDFVTLHGTDGDDDVTVTGDGVITGLAAGVSVTGADATGDWLEIHGGAGGDVLLNGEIVFDD